MWRDTPTGQLRTSRLGNRSWKGGPERCSPARGARHRQPQPRRRHKRRPRRHAPTHILRSRGQRVAKAAARRTKDGKGLRRACQRSQQRQRPATGAKGLPTHRQQRQRRGCQRSDSSGQRRHERPFRRARHPARHAGGGGVRRGHLGCRAPRIKASRLDDYFLSDLFSSLLRSQSPHLGWMLEMYPR